MSFPVCFLYSIRAALKTDWRGEGGVVVYIVDGNEGIKGRRFAIRGMWRYSWWEQWREGVRLLSELERHPALPGAVKYSNCTARGVGVIRAMLYMVSRRAHLPQPLVLMSDIKIPGYTTGLYLTRDDWQVLAAPRCTSRVLRWFNQF